jgi:hypothetical protein
MSDPAHPRRGFYLDRTLTFSIILTLSEMAKSLSRIERELLRDD